MRLQYKATS